MRRFGPGRDNAEPQLAQLASDSRLSRSATKLVERLLEVGIDGWGRFESAGEVVDRHAADSGDPERAIKRVVREHLKAGAAGGFVTGVGGFVTLPVALPANVLGFYILATRMSAAIAALRGYDIDAPEVRSAILLSLVGADAEELLRKAGYGSYGGLANVAAGRLPGPVMMAVNKGVGFRLLTQLSGRAFMRLGRGVPFVGGALGAGIDAVMLKEIADHVREEFPVQPVVPGMLTIP